MQIQKKFLRVSYGFLSHKFNTMFFSYANFQCSQRHSENKPRGLYF